MVFGVQKAVEQYNTEWEFIDGTYIKAHQHSAGACSAKSQAIGKSRAGLTTKIHLAVDSYGLPIEFIITGGEVHDSVAAAEDKNKVFSTKETKPTKVMQKPPFLSLKPRHH